MCLCEAKISTTRCERFFVEVLGYDNVVKYSIEISKPRVSPLIVGDLKSYIISMKSPGHFLAERQVQSLYGQVEGKQVKGNRPIKFCTESIKVLPIRKTRLCNILQFFTASKMIIFR